MSGFVTRLIFSPGDVIVVIKVIKTILSFVIIINIRYAFD